MSLNKLNQVVNSIAKMVEESEKIALPVLSAKLNKLAEVHPYDPTIVSVADVVGRMSEKHLFIRKADFKGLYNKFYTRNTRFAEFCQDELGLASIEAPSPVKYAEKQAEVTENLHEQFADQVLANALTSLFDKDAPLKMYAKDLAEKAKFSVAFNLDNWNLKASKIEVAAGNDKFIVVKADYDTPKGVTSFLVPVEVQKGKVLEPAVFMSNAGPQDLNHVNIKKYLTSYAGTSLKVTASDVVNVLTDAVSPKAEISDAELALTKLNASRENLGGTDSIIGQSVDSVYSEVNLPQSAEVETFAAKLSSPVGAANLHFGADKVAQARDVVARTVASFGLGAPQISVAGCDETTVFYAVALHGGKTAFKVPVKFSSNKVLPPTFMLCNGSLNALSKENVNKLLVSNETDFSVAAVASAQYSLKPSELIENISSALAEGNYAKAEDALNVIAQSGDETSYKQAFAVYVNGLNGVKQDEECKCNMVIKTAHSSHPVCGHTNLPLHKVYQDEFGNCQPLYRKAMKSDYQGAFFMNYKIFG